jgi:hypothetical protein
MSSLVRALGSWVRIPLKAWVSVFIDIREIGWDGMDWIDLAQDGDQSRALVNTVMNLRVP